MPDRIDSRLWGKFDGLPFPYPLGCHLLDTAAISIELWRTHLTSGQRRDIADAFGVPAAEACSMVAFWAGLHDIGKCCPSFQAQPSGPAPSFLSDEPFEAPEGWMHEGTVRHERVSHIVLPDLLRHYGYDSSSRPRRSMAHQVAQILGGHHGIYGPMLDRKSMVDPGGAEPRVGTAAGWVEQRGALVDVVYEACGRPVAPSKVAPAGVAVLVTGLVVLADWIASKVGWVLARQRDWDAHRGNDWLAHHRRACEAAPTAVAAAQLSAPTWRPANSFAEAFPQIATPHPLQADLAARLQGLVKNAGLLLVTAQTGDGKTESGLFGARVLGAASGRNGLAVLLPTMATTNAMWARITQYVSKNAWEDTPVTLLHGMAWLNPDYTGEDAEAVIEDGCISTTATDFLRGRHLGLVSGVTVGTWDQAAIAALPVRFNVLRWLGLSGKTVIIDEAHAYDAYGHALTIRLLEWLGHLRVPVVLLSATLSGAIARRLVNAYRRGSGHTEPSEVNAPYPGWLFADAETGEVTTSPILGSSRAHALHVDVHEIRHTHDTRVSGGRADRLHRELAPLYDVREDTGSALVVCNTVRDAQQTYLTLSGRRGTRRPRIVLLHARMPVWQREETTNSVLDALGPRAPRPQEPLVIVSTQVAEQSLDVDFDLVVSDLAPLAQLLQRAGRGHRHELGDRGSRPSWGDKPRLVVLSPLGQLPPRAWGEVYDEALLRRTRDELLQRQGGTIEVPGDVPKMIDTVYAELYELADAALDDDHQRASRDTAQTAAADAAAVPTPDNVIDLYAMTDQDIDPSQVTTRLGADSARILPVYHSPDGNIWLDRNCTHPLPMPEPGHKRLAREAVAGLVRLTVQAPASYLPAPDEDTRVPSEWQHTPIAQDLRLLPHTVDSQGTIHPFHHGRHTLELDATLGLVREIHNS
ncbi:CRISPR-associated helicase Cas3' [Streptomyces noursei]|uniref:CRISPR-associated helicase Cas3' n=1 Tax=Streptomyces noursei TaxID=1971 RepID=UPI00344F2E15